MATTRFVKAERLQKLPPYLFAEIDRKKKAAIAAGRDVINLGVGDPDRPTPAAIVRSLQPHVDNPAFHQYALDQGAPELRRSFAAFCRGATDWNSIPSRKSSLDRFQGGDRPLPLAVLNPGEISLVPDPATPLPEQQPLRRGRHLHDAAGAVPGVPPDLQAIPPDVYKRARLMFLNYPNNPTGGRPTCRSSSRSSSWPASIIS
ncbi:MAG: aminotransferase class I/II-fold pyridoxal phosphate-dependent enzyme [Singulisphaera sp.]